MVRIYRAVPAVLALALLGPLWAADETPADNAQKGKWKVTVYIQDKPQPLWILKLENKDGKWRCELAASHERIPASTISDFKTVKSKDGKETLQFILKLGETNLAFEGAAPAAGAKKFHGTFRQGAGVVPVDLERTTLQSLSEFDLAKEALAKHSDGMEAIDAATTLLRQASDNKAQPTDVISWAAKATEAAKAYGPRWERETVIRITSLLTEQQDYAAIAVDYARKAEKMLDPKEDRPSAQKRTLDLLAETLRKAKKEDEANEIEARIKKIDTEIKPVLFAGRKEKSERVSLVELFTGAECPPCVAADQAFDALSKTYKPSEVVLLQYHLHIPKPDPLTNPDGLKRAEFYGPAIRGTPTLILNGRPGPGIGGDAFDAAESYDDCRGAIDPTLEKASGASLKAAAVRKGSKITITAEAADVVEPGNKVRLRLALVEETIAYKGGNGVTAYHSVVRALPGGVEGLALKEKTGKQTATVDLDELRKSLKKYLDEFGGKDEESAFPNKERPLELKNLRVVAFIQNDQTREVYQAVQVEVKEEKSE
jgi:hypothetical protein